MSPSAARPCIAGIPEWQRDVGRRDRPATFAQYLAREKTIFADLQREVTEALPEEDKTPVNRFYRHSRVWPGQFQQDWNRSFVLLPLGKPRGVVLLHGLTDSPYSVRYLAQLWQQRGYVAVVPRLPGHGTAPGALTAVDWETGWRRRVWRYAKRPALPGRTCRCIWSATLTAARWRSSMPSIARRIATCVSRSRLFCCRR